MSAITETMFVFSFLSAVNLPLASKNVIFVPAEEATEEKRDRKEKDVCMYV